MNSETRTLSVPVADGAIPMQVAGLDEEAAGSGRPGLVCVPSIYGGNDDLLAQMASVADVAVTVVMDPFWRVQPGPIPYEDRDGAFERAGKIDREQTLDDLKAVANWLKGQTGGPVAGLGICFGGPWVLLAAASGDLSGVVCWHGSRLEQYLDRFDPASVTAPLRLHFGEIDPITPPEAIEAIGTAFADHPDCRLVVHPGADHGFSHEGAAWDESAASAGLADLRELLIALGT